MDGLSFKKGVRSEKIVIINPLAQKKKQIESTRGGIHSTLQATWVWPEQFPI